MKNTSLHKYLAAAVGAAVLSLGASRAIAQAGADPLAEHLYPPELVKQCHQALNLTEDQMEKLQAEARQAQERTEELRQKMQQEVEALAELVKKERPEEKAVLEQAGKVMDLEKEGKRTQLGLMVRIKNILTADQKAKLDEIKPRMKVLGDKMNRVRELVRQWQADGRDLSRLQVMRENLESAIQHGDVKAAEDLLDQALRMLNASKER